METGAGSGTNPNSLVNGEQFAQEHCQPASSFCSSTENHISRRMVLAHPRCQEREKSYVRAVSRLSDPNHPVSYGARLALDYRFGSTGGPAP